MFGLALVANLAPLVVARILPFNDLHGAAGLLGALCHRGDGNARIDDFFTFDIRPAPNVIYWAVGWVLTRVFSVEVATNIFIALFGVIALPFSFLLALRTLGKDPVLSFLAFPLIYHRCVWYGFMGSVPAVPLLLVIFACATVAFSRARAGWWDVGLAAAILGLSTAHAFLYLVTLGLVLVWVILAYRQPSSIARRLGVLLPSLMYIGPWLFTKILGDRAGSGGVTSLIQHLWSARPPFISYLRNAHAWLIDGYTGHVDDAVALVFAASLIAFLVFGVRPPSSVVHVGRPVDRPWALRTLFTATALAGGYFALPMTISRPMSWWAVHVRLLVPAILAIALLVPTRRRGLPRAALIPVAAAAVLYGCFLAYDFRTWWMDVELKGFSSALAAIPRGQRVHALYPPFGNEHHYSHFPMGYIVDYYVVERGGTAVPMMSGNDELWIQWRPQARSAPWGMATGGWQQYGTGWDYYLAKQPAPGNGPPQLFFRDAPIGAVSKVFEEGLWSVWKRN